MSEKRFIIVKSIYDYSALVDKERKDTKQILILSLHKEQLGAVCDLLNEQQATIEEYKDFCLNLCKFLIQKGFVDEYREKYGKEYKIITKWW